MKNFVLIGVAGYIAPKHLEAIKVTGNNLLAAVDKNDSVGILDSFFPFCDFFTEFERFDRHCEKLKRQGTKIDFVVVCSPNYLHDAHIRFGLRLGADVICEKPIVLNPWNVDALLEMESETGKNINCILQLRLHPSIKSLKEKISSQNKNQKYKIDLKYVTTRGNWYYASWKGDESKSGGIATNIGIHFFDMLLWIFGDVSENQVHTQNKSEANGTLYLEKATVNWSLSILEKHLPIEISNSSLKTYRALFIDEELFEFNHSFSELHIESYRNILSGNGFKLIETKKSIELVHQIRTIK